MSGSTVGDGQLGRLVGEERGGDRLARRVGVERPAGARLRHLQAGAAEGEAAVARLGAELGRRGRRRSASSAASSTVDDRVEVVTAGVVVPQPRGVPGPAAAGGGDRGLVVDARSRRRRGRPAAPRRRPRPGSRRRPARRARPRGRRPPRPAGGRRSRRPRRWCRGARRRRPRRRRRRSRRSRSRTSTSSSSPTTRPPGRSRASVPIARDILGVGRGDVLAAALAARAWQRRDRGSDHDERPAGAAGSPARRRPRGSRPRAGRRASRSTTERRSRAANGSRVAQPGPTATSVAATAAAASASPHQWPWTATAATADRPRPTTSSTSASEDPHHSAGEEVRLEALGAGAGRAAHDPVGLLAPERVAALAAAEERPVLLDLGPVLGQRASSSARRRPSRRSAWRSARPG